MTARAKPLTDRATIPAQTFGVFVEGLRTLGYDTVSLLESTGLAPADLADPDAQVPCESCGILFGGACRQRFTPNLALALAQATPLGAWPLLDYLVATADTVGAGLHQLARYFDVSGDSIVLTICHSVDPIRIDIAASAPFAVEFEAALMVVRLREETGGRFTAAELSFRHAVDDAAAFARAVGCPVVDRAAWDGLSVSSASWQLPLRRRDPILRKLLEQQASAILSRLPARSGLAHDVQRAVTARIGSGDTRIESVGRALAMSPRTLQRRLSAEGVSYQQLLEDARKEAAGRYLADGTLAIGEIAYLLGYAEPAPFHRAFRRWYGTTPESYRRSVRTGT